MNGEPPLPPTAWPPAAPPLPPPLPPPPPPSPRVWTPLVALLIVLPAMIVAQIIALFVGLAVTGQSILDPKSIADFVKTSPGFLLILVTSQIVFLSAALIPAIASPVPFRERLGLVRARVHPATWPVLVLGSPFLLVVGGLLRVLVFGAEPSEHLEDFGRVFEEAPGLWGPVLALAASVLPGICEEAFFRGYIQRRLLLRWTPALAVGFTSVAFACVHLDPQQMVAVIPVAFWLGYVGWRTSSLWPCILCHFVFNGTSLTMALAGVNEERLGQPGPAIIALLVMGLAFLCFVGSIILLEISATRRRRG